MLYRKYRPQVFDEVVGQEHVVKTLQGALKTGRLGHAYLFTGPRGTGKTTLARIFAKSLNCANYKDGKTKGQVPCGECDFCKAVEGGTSLDLIEIDAASNRGIDEIRNLKESALVAAPSGGYKVFLIDEVHMLTKDAFNALLKILEEPPSHVVFILATTEPHKILATVLSRVQRFDFKRLTNKQISEKLKEIASAEKIDIDSDGLMAIATSSDGALRDAEVSLAKVRSSAQGLSSQAGKITVENVNSTLGLIPANYHPKFLKHLLLNERSEAIGLIHKVYESGLDLEHFSKSFIEYLRKVLIFRSNPAVLASVGDDFGEEAKSLSDIAEKLDNQKLIKLITIFTTARNEIKNSPVPQLPLELAVCEFTA